MFKILTTAAILIPIAAQAQTARFDRPGTSQQTFMADRFACIQASQQQRSRGHLFTYNFGNGPQIMGNAGGGTVISTSMFLSCMGAKGYSRTENGKLAAPEGSIVRGAP